MKSLTILCLYPDEMNFYGDMGNVLALRKRLEWRGLGSTVRYHHPGAAFPREAMDVVVGGGGQDSSQLLIHRDLLAHGSTLQRLADGGTPMLMVCGLYQLFGRRFVTAAGEELPGIGIFDAETIASPKRLVGDIVVQSPFGRLEGYENHSGHTRLLGDQQPLGTVLSGFGNNDAARDEGAAYQNVYGTYLHGAVLPRNPAFADTLLTIALQRKYGASASLPSLQELF